MKPAVKQYANRDRGSPGPWHSVSRKLDRFAESLDTRPWILFAAIFVLYGYVLRHWRNKPLWFDELYTYHIAQAPTFHQMIAWTRQIDMNPPLYYIAARLSFHVFHPSKFAAHLPAMIAYFVAVLCAYQFVRRRLTPTYGFIAALVLLGSSYNLYSSEARPYSFILGFLGIAAIGWQRAIEPPRKFRWLSLLAIIFGGFGMLLSHVLALVPYAALLFAELIRFLFRRKTDWLLWICMLVPLCSCVLYWPLLHQHSTGIYTPVFQASIMAGFKDYSELWVAIAPFFAIALILSLAAERNAAPAIERTDTRPINWPELVFLLCLLLVPLAIVVEFMRSHTQFFLRYGIPVIFAASILVAYLLAWLTRSSRRAAIIASLVFLLFVIRPNTFARILQDKLTPPNPVSAASQVLTVPMNQIDPQLPFVDADGHTFLEMNHREDPQFLSRIYYLIDPAAAALYSHSSAYNGLPGLVGKFPIRGNIESYRKFIQNHNKFLVLGNFNYPDDWLLNKLLADHATVRFLGDYKSDYPDDQIYEVTLASP